MTQRSACARALIIAPLLLAACASDDTNGTQTAAATATQQNATTEQGDRINLARCEKQAEGRVFFKVGKTTLAVPAPAVRDAVPSSLKQPFTTEQVKPELQRQAAAGGGCPEKPIEARYLSWQTEPKSPLLVGDISLANAPAGALTSQFAKLTGQLQANPTQNCKDVGGNLIGCIGTETKRRPDGTEDKTQVMYVITTDRTARLSTGGPLSARCVLEDGKVLGCSLVDELPGDVAFDVTLKPGSYTTTGLDAARSEAIANITALQKR